MTKYTTTLFEIIDSELNKSGIHEFVNRVDDKTQFTGHNKQFAFMQRLQTYDTDVASIITREIFGGIMFDLSVDEHFKKAFVNRFLNRQIKYQTKDLFVSKIVGQMIIDEALITQLFKNLNNFYSNSGSNNVSRETNDGNNGLFADLPQDNVNMDLTASTSDYASNNTINRGFSKQNETNESSKFDASAFEKLQDVVENLFNKYDNKFFLRVW